MTAGLCSTKSNSNEKSTQTDTNTAHWQSQKLSPCHKPLPFSWRRPSSTNPVWWRSMHI